MASIPTAAAFSTAGSGSDRESNRPETVTEPTNGLNADFDTFLTLLTAQMRYQDPLEPIDSTEFVAQLAQFSAVEQQVETNKMLESILEQMNGGAASGLSQWLGRDVLVEAPLAYSGGEVSLYPQDPADLTPISGALVIRNLDGDTVGEAKFQPGAEGLVWDGTLTDGETLPPGSYTLTARYGDGTGNTETAPVRHYLRVEESRMGSDGVELVLGGGWVVNADDVAGARDPQA
jgi:flagellar basal-body rod modification protein FlgD